MSTASEHRIERTPARSVLRAWLLNALRTGRRTCASHAQCNCMRRTGQGAARGPVRRGGGGRGGGGGSGGRRRASTTCTSPLHSTAGHGDLGHSPGSVRSLHTALCNTAVRRTAMSRANAHLLKAPCPSAIYSRYNAPQATARRGSLRRRPRDGAGLKSHARRRHRQEA